MPIPEEIKSLETMEIKENDILILKGNFTMEELQAVTTALQHRKKNNIILCLSNETSFETLKQSELETILQKLIENRKNETASTAKID